MSGNLKLKGATSGSSQISAPDTGTDEQFILPAVGGELVTAPVGGQVVGYQRGVWTANFMRGQQNNNGQLDTSDDNTFDRVGQLVTITVARLAAADTDSSGSVGNLPYPIMGDRLSGTTSDETGIYNQASDYISFRSPFARRYCRFTVTYRTDDTTWQPQNGATIQ